MSYKIIVYTARLGEGLKEFEAKAVSERNQRIEYVYFGNQEPKEELGWTWRFHSPSPHPRLEARGLRLQCCDLFPEAEFSIWMDSEYRILGRPLSELVQKLQDADIGLFKHPEKRDSILDELRACIAYDKEPDPEPMRSQVSKYMRDPSFRNHKVFATGILVRRHNEKVKAFNLAWLKEIEDFSVRDQLSFPYIVCKEAITPKIFGGGDAYRNDYFSHIKYAL